MKIIGGVRITTYDGGYGVVTQYGERRCARLHFPFPITLKSWRYTLRRWSRK